MGGKPGGRERINSLNQGTKLVMIRAIQSRLSSTRIHALGSQRYSLATKQQEAPKVNVAETENNWTEFNGLGHSKGNKKDGGTKPHPFSPSGKCLHPLIDEGSVLRWGQVRPIRAGSQWGLVTGQRRVCAMVQRCSQTIQRSLHGDEDCLFSVKPLQNPAEKSWLHKHKPQEMPTWKYWDWNWGRHKETIHLEMT